MNRNRPSEHRLSDNRSFRRPWYMMMFPRILSAAAQRRLQAHLKKAVWSPILPSLAMAWAVSLLCLKHSINWFIWKNDRNTKAWLSLAIAWNSCNLCCKGRLKISKPCCMKHGRLRKLFIAGRQKVLPSLRGKRRSKLAVRVPAHAGARRLCQVLEMPLVSTSCNRAGKRACKTEREVRRQFGRKVWVVGGLIGKQKTPSQIIDGETGARLR